MNTIQARVDSMIVPSDIGRIPRKIAPSFAGFTAEQWKNWVILYFMLALRGMLSCLLSVAFYPKNTISVGKPLC